MKERNNRTLKAERNMSEGDSEMAGVMTWTGGSQWKGLLAVPIHMRS
jgi:hypothetical protein